MLSTVATVYPQDATSGKVTWYSSDEDVATVDDNGVVSALNGGYTWIEARTENGYTAGCEVNVIVSVKSISLEYTSLTLTEGERHGIMETIYPEDATNKEVTWTSSNESVATSLSVLPFLISILCLFRLIPVTEISQSSLLQELKERSKTDIIMLHTCIIFVIIK